MRFVLLICVIIIQLMKIRYSVEDISVIIDRIKFLTDIGQYLEPLIEESN